MSGGPRNVLKGGVIGFGNIGQQLTRHIGDAWQGRARIVAACNRGPENLAVARDRFALAVTHDLAELLAMDLDFVLVTSTSAAHAAQVEAAAGRGLAVFCEKPIALTLEDADRAIAAVERAGVVTVVNYSLRFIEAYRTIRELAHSGGLGRILAVHHLRTRGYGLYEAGARHRAVTEAHESGGWTVHHACHDIDLLSWVHGPIVRAYARAATTVPGGASEEVVLGMVDFADGAVGSIGDSVCRIREHATLVIGSRASLAMSGEAGSTVLRLHREGSDRPEIITARDEKRPGGGLDHFLECVLAGRPSPDSLRSARHSLAVALAMRESARTGRPVDVPPENPPAAP
ncbi:MAG: Gfo/Idh/MocA family oxidoreductase [Spirochaetes bacterium]|nr:Gfo/Idh/MocA family oxidoreductase [Spirochaetota bacterium]